MAHLFGSTNSLPHDHAALAALIDAQPARVRQAFHYLLCLAMADRGGLRPIETHAGAGGEVAVFESREAAGETFTILRPPIAPDVEARMTAALRDILDEDTP